MSLSVTVGIPTCNNEATIRETLRQLVEGTRPPDRILVVDASTDRTPKIVDEVAAESQVPIDRYEQSDRGRGVGAARQDIYDRFEGDVLACLDTNVRVDADWLAERVRFHEEHPEYDVLSSAPLSDVDGPVDDPKRGFYFQQANCSIRAAALDRVGGWDPWLPRGEDWDMGIRLWRAGARVYARSDLHGDQMVEESQTLSKTLGRPSSVAFLRKYGGWYLRFHPTHPLGDALSIVGLLALVATPLLLVLAPVLALGTAGLAAGLTALYLWLKLVPHREAWRPRLRDLHRTPRFFLLGYTALREFAAGDRPWNRGGLDGETTE